MLCDNASAVYASIVLARGKIKAQDNGTSVQVAFTENLSYYIAASAFNIQSNMS